MTSVTSHPIWSITTESRLFPTQLHLASLEPFHLFRLGVLSEKGMSRAKARKYTLASQHPMPFELHTRSHIHRVHTCMLAFMHSHTHMHACVHTHTECTHARVHSCTHTHVHACAHTHTHHLFVSQEQPLDTDEHEITATQTTKKEVLCSVRLSLHGQSFLTSLSIDKNNKKGNRQGQKKSCGGWCQ